MSFGVGIGDVIKLCELAGRVYKNCRDCTGEYKHLTNEARSLSNLLEDIQDKYDKIPENKRQQLTDAYEPCAEVLQEFDKLLLHYNSLDTKSKRAWDRLRWNPDKTRTLRERLASNVSMLNTFYTSLIHDSQVLILEALERLENDYRNGHREESIASVEQFTSSNVQDEREDHDAAWSQVLRDLEDVGVSQQEALTHRNVIVDWLVAAVNEGRFLEQPPEPDSFFSLPQDLGAALPTLEQMGNRGAYNVDSQASLPSVQRSTPASILAPSPLLSPLMPQDQRDYMNPSAASLPVSGRSSTSLKTRSSSPVEDAPPIRARSQPSPVSACPTYESSRVPVSHSSAFHILATPSTSLAASNVPTTASSIPSAPLTYNEQGTSVTADLEWTARQIVDAWSRRDFYTAERLLEDQLTAVESGQTVRSGTQPDHRILRHLIGVCASFTGNFVKAKRFFESVFNGIHLSHGNLDDGDIAAARWLGDVCLHLREHHNAVLAYSVAFEGSIRRFGAAHNRTRRISDELLLLDHWLYVFRRVEHSFHLNSDPTDIFSSTHGIEKSNLMVSVKARLYALNGSDTGQEQLIRPLVLISIRPRIERACMLSENLLAGPLILLSAWPFPWDHTFSPADAVKLDRYMNIARIAGAPTPLVNRPLPTGRLGDAKKLHYVTKRDSQWLIETVKTGLQEIGIEHAEHGFDASIVCRLSQHRDGFAFFEGVQICFTKLQFRNTYGIKITNVVWATRRFEAIGAAQLQRDTTDFREIIKTILEKAEADASSMIPKNNAHLESTSMFRSRLRRSYSRSGSMGESQR